MGKMRFSCNKHKSKFSIGILLLILSVYSNSILNRLGYELSWEIGKYSEHSFAYVLDVTPSGEPIPPEPKITIGHPKSALITESSGINLKFEWPSIIPLTSPVSARIVSSSFDVAPPDKITYDVVNVAPTLFSWVVTPRKEGSHLLLLEVEYSIKWQDDKKQKPISKIQNRTYPINIYVLTILGISPLLFYIIKTSGIVISFVLLYPLVPDQLKERIRRNRQNKEKSKIIIP